MRDNQGTDPRGNQDVHIPEWFLSLMGPMSEEYLRIAIYFHLAEHRAGQIGVSVSVGELARGTGLHRDRVRAALEALSGSRVVPAGPNSWRWLPLVPPTAADTHE